MMSQPTQSSGTEASGAMRFAYADPPYPRQARRHYGDHPDFAGEVDHGALIERLTAEYPDGWALSTSAQALPEILALCPRPRYNRHGRQEAGSIHVCAWVRQMHGVYPVSVQWAWEPLIVVGGRQKPGRRPMVRDWWNGSAWGTGFIGAKPRGFCHWLFELLGAEPQDELDDLFPGSGAVSRAWREWTARGPAAAGEQVTMAV